MSGWIKAILLLIFSWYGAWLLWRFGLLRSKHSILRLTRKANGRFQIQTTKNIFEAEVCGSSTVTRLVSILRFRKNDHRWQWLIPSYLQPNSCIIFKDALSPDDYRKLLVVLKMY